MSFDLAFWHEDQPITAKHALQVYEEPCEGSGLLVTSDPALARFLRDLTRRYPPIGTYPEEQLDACPWSCEWSVMPGSVILCMTWPRGRELAPLLIQLANQYDLLCYRAAL
jgi:hypothetical protein